MATPIDVSDVVASINTLGRIALHTETLARLEFLHKTFAAFQTTVHDKSTRDGYKFITDVLTLMIELNKTIAREK